MTALSVDLWPPAGLRVRAGAVELRPPCDDDLPALAALFPTETGWDPTLLVTGADAEARGRQSVLRHVWRARAECAPARWRLCLAVFLDGEPVGEQDLKAADFPVRRIVETSSWLGAAYRGRGLGTTMRTLALHLAFEGFGAVAVETSFVEGNAPALGVTRSLGYTPCGDTWEAFEGVRTHLLWSRLTRERWAGGDGRAGPVTLTGVAPVRELLGIGAPG